MKEMRREDLSAESFRISIVGIGDLGARHVAYFAQQGISGEIYKNIYIDYQSADSDCSALPEFSKKAWPIAVFVVADRDAHLKQVKAILQQVRDAQCLVIGIVVVPDNAQDNSTLTIESVNCCKWGGG